MSGIAQTSERAGAGVGDEFNRKLAETKERAQMAKEEFAGIPAPLKESVVALAGIGAELQGIVEKRELLRQTFGEIYNGLSGENQDKFASFAANFEAKLGLQKRADELLAESRQRGADILGNVEGNTSSLQGDIRQNELAGRKPFRDSAATLGTGGDITAQMVRDAATLASIPEKISACANVASQMLHRLNIPVEANNNVAELEKNIKKLGVKTVSLADARPGDTLIWDTQKSREFGEHWRYGSVSGKHVEIYEGDGKSDGNGGGARRNPRHISQPLYDKRALTIYETSALAGGAATTSPASSSSASAHESDLVPVNGKNGFEGYTTRANLALRNKAAQIVAPLPAPAPSGAPAQKRDVSSTLPPVSGYESIVGTFHKLPKSWNTAMGEYRPQPGEQTRYREQFEKLLLALEAKGVKVPDAQAKHARALMGSFDVSSSIKTATDKAARDIADMGVRIRLAGRENNPYLVLLDEFEHGEKRFVSRGGQSALLQMTLAQMRANIGAATRESARQSRSSVAMSSENEAMLGDAHFNAPSYERAQFQTGKRFEIWNSSDILLLSQAIEHLKKSGQFLEAEREQKLLNAQATTRLSSAMRVYDAQQGEGILRLHAEEMKRLSDEGDAFERVAALRLNAGLSPRARENQAASAADEQSAREKLAPAFKMDARPLSQRLADSVTGGAPFVSNPLQQLRLGAAVAGQVGGADANRRAGQTGKDNDANTLAANGARDSLATLQNQLALVGRFRSGSPQLSIEEGVARERQSLLGGEFKDRVSRGADGSPQLDAATQAELDKRLDAKRRELEMEQKIKMVADARRLDEDSSVRVLDGEFALKTRLARTERERLQIAFDLQDAQRKRTYGDDYAPGLEERLNRLKLLDQGDKGEHQGNALQAENALQDLRKAGELARVHSAKERLEIEFKYQDLLRSPDAQHPYLPDEKEQAARQAQRAEADKNDRFSDLKSAAGQMHGILSDAISTGLKDGSAKGVRSMIQNLEGALFKEFADRASAKLTNRVFRHKAGTAEVVDTKPGLFGVMMGRDKADDADTQGAAVPRLPKGAMTARFALSAPRSAALAHLAACSAGPGTVGTGGAAQLQSAVINVQGKTDIHAPGANVHLPDANTSGGVGSKPSGDQFLGRLSSVGSFASNLESLTGGGGLF